MIKINSTLKTVWLLLRALPHRGKLLLLLLFSIINAIVEVSSLYILSQSFSILLSASDDTSVKLDFLSMSPLMLLILGSSLLGISTCLSLLTYVYSSLLGWQSWRQLLITALQRLSLVPANQNLNISKTIKTVLHDTSLIGPDLLLPIGQVISKATIVLFFIAYLLYSYPFQSALIGTIVLPILYLYIRIGNRCLANSSRISHSHQESSVAISESILLTRLYFQSLPASKRFLFQRLHSNSLSIPTHEAIKSFFVVLPKHFFELIVSVLLIIGSIVYYNYPSVITSQASLLPVLLFAYTRIMPCVNLVLTNISCINSRLPQTSAALKHVVKQDSVSSSTYNYSGYSHKTSPSLKIVNLKAHSIASSPSLIVPFFEAKPSSLSLIKGRSGSGKSTFFYLLSTSLAYGIPQNVEADVFTLPSTYFFSDNTQGLINASLYENIFFDDHVSDYRIRSVLREARLLDEVLADTPINENTVKNLMINDYGHGISLGQRQRILVARAFYLEPSLYIFDESLSGTGTHENYIYQNLIKSGSSVIVISHNNDLDAHADSIYQMQPLADGSGSELIKTHSKLSL